MAKKIISPRGTADILPTQIPYWYEIESISRNMLSIYGYREIRTPYFEETELFARSVGQSSDIVQKQMLNLSAQIDQNSNKTDKDIKLSGLSLRPEGTAAVVRSYIQNSLDRQESLSKLYYLGPMFRGERPQKGRLRQFHQIGVEAIGPGSSSPYLDAEIIALSIRLLNEYGLENFTLKVNTLGSEEDKKVFGESLRAQLKNYIPELCLDCQQRFNRNVFRILDCKSKDCVSIVSELDLSHSYLSDESKQYFDQVIMLLDNMGVKYEKCGSLVRGLDYYTHTVFEISDKSLGSQDALGAGGRYNGLVQQLGGPKVDAVGFALGIERILLSKLKEQEFVDKALDAYLIALDENALEQTFSLMDRMRQNINCRYKERNIDRLLSVDMGYRFSSMKSQMRSANKSGAKFVIILGEDELREGTVSIKNMTTGEQKKEKIEDISKIVNIIYST